MTSQSRVAIGQWKEQLPSVHWLTLLGYIKYTKSPPYGVLTELGEGKADGLDPQNNRVQVSIVGNAMSGEREERGSGILSWVKEIDEAGQDAAMSACGEGWGRNLGWREMNKEWEREKERVPGVTHPVTQPATE